MSILTPRNVFAPGREPPKREIIQLLEQIIGGVASSAVGDFKGPWSIDAEYIETDFVEHGGSLWYAKSDNSGITPTEGETWAILLPGVTVADGTVTWAKLAAEVQSILVYSFETVADLLADTTLSYTTGSRVVAAGDVLAAGGFRYIVAASNATEIAHNNLSGYHLATAGGVKLRVDRLPGQGFNVRAFGAKGDYDDDTEAFQKALWALKPGGGGKLYIPNGGYYIHQTLVPPSDCAGLHLIGEGVRATLVAWASSTADDLFAWSADLDHVICENFAMGNVGNCDRLMVIACVRSRFRDMWFRPTTAVNESLVAATTGVTTYALHFEDCHFESVSQAQLNGRGLDIPRGHSLKVSGCFFSGVRFPIRLGTASIPIDGVSITDTRFETFSGLSSDRPGHSDCICIDAVNVRGLGITNCNFELGADEVGSSAHRALVLRQFAQGGLISGCFMIGHGTVSSAIEVAHTSAYFAARGNVFNRFTGYGIYASAGDSSQVNAPSGTNWATGGTTGVSA